MNKTLLIASSKMVQPEQWDEFKQAIMDSAFHGHNVEVNDMEITNGPHCVNYAMRISGTSAEMEAFANELTMALMPARWCYTDSPLNPGYHLNLQACKN